MSSDKKGRVIHLSKEGQRLFREGRYAEAEEKCRSALSIEPHDVYSLVCLGEIHRKKKRFREALACYEQALKVDEKNKFALAGAGDACRGLHDLDRALVFWFHYLNLYPGDYRVLTRVADGLRKKGDLQGAKNHYFLALGVEPQDPFALMGLGEVFEREGDEEEALRYYERAVPVSTDPNRPLASAAAVLRRKRDYKAALGYYDRILERNPEDSYGWHGRADCYRGLGVHGRSLESWEKALRYGMEPRIALTRMGDACLSLGDLSMAEQYYGEALKLGYDRYAYLGMARLRARRNETEEALEILSLVTRREPHEPRVKAEIRKIREQIAGAGS